MSTILLKRPLTGYAFRPISSYTKVREFISPIVRGKLWSIRRTRIKDKVLLNIGCGPYSKDNFINLNFEWHPGIDITWDITAKKIPLRSSFLEGVYTEHCLEHISFEKCLENLKETYRMLKPNGTIRIIVPDAEIYFDMYQARKKDPSVKLPYSDKEKEETAIISINRIFRAHEHLFIYDFETLALLLQKAGFRNITKESYRTGRDSRLLIDLPERAVESLYVEASK
jgi:predicted SAM-dependent methyltransferase